LLHHGLALPRGETRGIHGGWIAVLHHPASELWFQAGTLLMAFALSLLVTAIVSAFTRAQENAATAALVRSARDTARTAWWKRPETLAIAILVAAAAACAPFV